MMRMDSQHLMDCLKRLPRLGQIYMIGAYRKVWIDAEALEPVKHRKSNKGRRAANTFIRTELEDMRHPEPDIVKTWREGPPKCCHTCDCYRPDGVCSKFSMEPPEDFAGTKGACGDWMLECPF